MDTIPKDQSNSLFRFIADQSNDLILLINKTKHVTYFNKICLEIFENLDNINTFVSDLSLPNLQSTIIKTNAQDKKTTTISWSSLTPKSTKQNYTLLIGKNISEIEKLKNENNHLNYIIEKTPGYVFWKDANSVLMGCNENFANQVNLQNPRDIVGKTDYELPWTEEQTESYRKNDKEVMTSGTPQLNIEEQQRQADGSTITVLTSKVPTYDETGKANGVLGIYIDITERKKIEKNLKQTKEGSKRVAIEIQKRTANNLLPVDTENIPAEMAPLISELNQLFWRLQESLRAETTPSSLSSLDISNTPLEIKPLISELNHLFLQLQESFQRENRFTDNAAHALKTPLAALRTQIQVACNIATDEDKHKKALEKILHGVDRCSHIVKQLLTVNRMNVEHSAKKTTKPVELNKKATQIITNLSKEASKKGIKIEFQTDKKQHTILGQSTAISVLLRNIIDNAIRYTPKNGHVKVIIKNQANNIILRVIDNGPGIPTKLQKQVFERFYQINGHNSSGSGLGLGIIEQIAKMHGAKLELLTPPSKKGLEVKISFPRYSSAN